MQNEETVKYADALAARNNFLAETDGSGGTGKIGVKDVAKAKQIEYEKSDAAYKELQQNNKPKIDAVDKELKEIETSIKKAEADFTTYLNNGFLTRIEALTNLLKTNQALQFRYYLIVFILMLIELMPVIAKTMLPSGSYDEKAMLREQMEIELANSNIRKEQLLKEVYNQMAFDNDQQAIKDFFALTQNERSEKIRSFSEKWKSDHNQPFDGLWEKMKKEILTKQEN